ncbi:MAG: replication initiation protein [Streptococcaceae bacterium]|jgi:plasmid replication initiation protein|nr:replication initiation protein [Streptococcaceae bacterium]
MANETVKYNNELNTVVMSRWTKEEMNLFFSIISRLKEQNGFAAINDSELRQLSKIKTKDYSQYKASVQKLSEKLNTLQFWKETDDAISPFSGRKVKKLTLQSVFKSMDIYDKEGLYIEGITIDINQEFLFLFKELSRNYTTFELLEFQNIQSTYAKTMYRLLKQWKTIGKKEFHLEDLYVLLDVPEAGRNRKYFTDRVLKPVKKELLKYFQGLSVKPLVDKSYSSRGRKPVIGYSFTWQKQESNEWIEGKYELKEENRQAEKESNSESYVRKFPNGSQKVIKREKLPEYIIEQEKFSKQKKSSVSSDKLSDVDDAFEALMKTLEQKN